MIITLPIRGIERRVAVIWDDHRLAEEAVVDVEFRDGLPAVDLTEAERETVAREADERAYLRQLAAGRVATVVLLAVAVTGFAWTSPAWATTDEPLISETVGAIGFLVLAILSLGMAMFWPSRDDRRGCPHAEAHGEASALGREDGR